MNSPITPLFTLQEAAALIHRTCKPASLRAAIEEGRLQARKIGRALYVTSDDLSSYLESCRLCPAPAKAPASASSAPMIVMAPNSVPGSANTAGISYGSRMDGAVNVRRASTIAQQLKSGKMPSRTSSSSSRGADVRADRAVPTK